MKGNLAKIHKSSNNNCVGILFVYVGTVGGRNPAPVEVGSSSRYLLYIYIIFTGFHTSQVVGLGISQPSTGIRSPRLPPIPRRRQSRKRGRQQLRLAERIGLGTWWKSPGGEWSVALDI